jgi:hypothetical protein
MAVQYIKLALHNNQTIEQIEEVRFLPGFEGRFPPITTHPPPHTHLIVFPVSTHTTTTTTVATASQNKCAASLDTWQCSTSSWRYTTARPSSQNTHSPTASEATALFLLLSL